METKIVEQRQVRRRAIQTNGHAAAQEVDMATHCQAGAFSLALGEPFTEL
jgi:hypothetical protein